MQTKSIYLQLQPEERMTIASMKQTGSSVRATARALGRSASTVSRELTRNSCPDAAYASSAAQSRSHDRRRHARPVAKLHPRSGLWLIVLSMLDWNWSPQQISGILKRVYPTDASKHVSHETIYTAIYAHPRGELRRQLIECLRQGRSTRLPRTDRARIEGHGSRVRSCFQAKVLPLPNLSGNLIDCKTWVSKFGKLASPAVTTWSRWAGIAQNTPLDDATLLCSHVATTM